MNNSSICRLMALVACLVMVGCSDAPPEGPLDAGGLWDGAGDLTVDGESELSPPDEGRDDLAAPPDGPPDLAQDAPADSLPDHFLREDAALADLTLDAEPDGKADLGADAAIADIPQDQTEPPPDAPRQDLAQADLAQADIPHREDIWPFPPQAVELSHEPDHGSGTILDFHWDPIIGYDGVYSIGDERMWEAVRWDLTSPATVYGARVMWGELNQQGPVALGAYPDFGSNGFDFDQWSPLQEIELTLSPEDEGRWVDVLFDPPLEVELPGLFWVAHLFEPPDGPAWQFNHKTLDCALYHGCHSALNMPEAEPYQYYNGLSMAFPSNYSVRLVVELHDTIAPEDKWFQVDPALRASSRVAWGDYNNDGFDDLMTDGPTLHRNNGDGTFTDVTAEAGLVGLLGWSSGGVWGDYDNDGFLDYFGQGAGYTTVDVLVRNNGDGTFTDQTLPSGINDIQSDVDCDPNADEERSPTEGSAWVDLDSDGYIDLYLANHECWETAAHYRDRVWHNEGDGTFTEWDTDHGFSSQRLAGRGVSPIDLDRDQDMDVLVSNYRLERNFLFENLGDGTFREDGDGWNVAGQATLVDNTYLYYGHTIGSAWLDLDNDGHWDLIESNLAHPRLYHFSNRLMVLRNNGYEWFEDISQEAGIFYRETHSNPTVQDFDNDGDTDLFVTAVYDGRFSEMYMNDGQGHFTQVNYESGAIVHNGWGSAASDYDNDGDVDLVAYDLFRNDRAALGHHWIQVRALGGVTANRAGLGAVVEVEAEGVTRMGHVSGGSGTACQDSMFLSFGLGPATVVDGIRVLYPGGATVAVPGPIEADQRVWVYEDGTVTYGWTP